VGRYIESDPIGLDGGPNTYTYALENPIALVDPFGLDPANLGDGYTGRVDQFDVGGKSSFEIHVFDKNGSEVGVYGPNGWINKHGKAGKPPGLPPNVENSCKGIAVERMRSAGELPKKGRANIKGTRWMRIMRAMPLLGPAIEETRPSPQRACELDPSFEGC
jgi:hypothetical protein